MRVLVIGPSATKSKGGMATVIEEIMADPLLQERFEIEAFESYADGNKLKVLLYSGLKLCQFILTGKAKKYDIYHIHAASCTSTFRKSLYVKLIKRHHKKVVFHIHGAEYMKFYTQLSTEMKKYVVNLLNSVDVVVALSDEWKRKFEKSFGISNCIAIENGINESRLAPANTSSKNYAHAFVSLGRLGHRKGTYDLINAVAIAVQKVPDVKLYLAGDGEIERAKVLVQKNHLEKNVEIVGWADFDKKLELLGKCATVVLPSYDEGLPMCVLEGMACGKAIISTTVGAIPEVVKADNGVLLEPGNVEKLAQTMVEFCTDLEMLEKMSACNIEKIQREFSMKIMHEKIAQCYEDALAM